MKQLENTTRSSMQATTTPTPIATAVSRSAAGDNGSACSTHFQAAIKLIKQSQSHDAASKTF
jgi:hypothetical protein